MRSAPRHGNARAGAKTPEYYAWMNMRGRCNNPKADRYPRYGGRGITVCDRWQTSFENFLADMGPRPPGTTLDRKNNDGNYEPGNCRWATRTEQESNKSTSLTLMVAGERLHVSEVARRNGVKPDTAFKRILNGWPIENAVSRQPKPWRK